MLTMNSDTHPIFQRMHRPVPKLPPEAQHQRMVVVPDAEAWDQWLEARPEQAKGLVRQAPVSVFIAEPDPPRGRIPRLRS